MGMGAGMLWSTGIPAIVSMAPAYAGRLTSLIESGVGLGVAIGPPIGSLVYSLGGYMYPFVISGSIEIVLVVIAVIAMPTRPARSEKPRSTEEIEQHEELPKNDDK